MFRKITFLSCLFSVLSVGAQKIDPVLIHTLRDNTQTIERVKRQRVQGRYKAPRSMTIYNKVTGDTLLFDHSNEVNGVDTMLIKSRLHASFNADGSIRSFVVLGTLQEGKSLPEEELTQMGIRVTDRIGRNVIMTIPASSLDALSQMTAFSRISASRVYETSNDVSREATSVAYVTGENEYNLFSSRYTGKDVVVGIIDQGIDFNHAAFRNPETGETRIKMACHFNSDNSMVRHIDLTEINKLETYNTSTSHGTHTSATAAGSKISDNGLHGMAPDADLILCDLGSSFAVDRIVSAANAIYEYAKQAGKPAVVNLSIGGVDDFHDGLDNYTSILRALTGKGKIMCVSAGNDGYNLPLSIRRTLGTPVADDYQLKTAVASNEQTDSEITPYSHGVYLLIYANDTQPFTVELKAVNVTTGELYSLSEKPLYKLATDELLSYSLPTVAVNEEHHKMATEFKLGAFQFNEKGLALAVLIKGQEGQQIAMIDSYAASNKNYTALVGSSAQPALSGYVNGTSELSINTFCCDDNIISVGAYVQSPYFLSLLDGKKYGNPNNRKQGRIATFSSYGVDDNGVARPDFITPGMWMNSAYSIYDKTYFNADHTINTEAKAKNRVTNYGEFSFGEYTRTNAYGAMSGTSMSCPVATGIVALWLQADPTLSPADVRELARKTCLNDRWTTVTDSIPSHNVVQAGMGKLDALRGIKQIENEKANEELYPLDEIITISNGLATYSSLNKLDFNSSTAPKAYVASRYAGDTLTFQRVGKIANETGILLVGSGSYKVPIAPSGTDVSENNLLKSTASGAVTLEQEGEAYVLSRQNGQIGFYQNAAGLTIPQGKAYLVLPSEASSSVKASGFVLMDGEEGTADDEIINISDDELALSALRVERNDADLIEYIESDLPASKLAGYNLNGQRINADYRGIVIKNGKKYLAF